MRYMRVSSCSMMALVHPTESWAAKWQNSSESTDHAPLITHTHTHRLTWPPHCLVACMATASFLPGLYALQVEGEGENYYDAEE
jgi:hypothetical protein